ncbi:hypothetical protein C0Q70_10241 [Pomacea canaliculata]|uniref:Uncharacterized protein n=1 Tax=Pomacea canaliculata TaxID=400727 RepID=A0A2T7PC25_POMCA|nr:hypothetical protein C0Q70_10241 [Pomacea canaliculata]
MSTNGIPDCPVKTFAAMLKPVNLTSSPSAPPVFSYFVTDYSTSYASREREDGVLVDSLRSLPHHELIPMTPRPRTLMVCNLYGVKLLPRSAGGNHALRTICLTSTQPEKDFHPHLEANCGRLTAQRALTLTPPAIIRVSSSFKCITDISPC